MYPTTSEIRSFIVYGSYIIFELSNFMNGLCPSSNLYQFFRNNKNSFKKHFLLIIYH